MPHLNIAGCLQDVIRSLIDAGVAKYGASGEYRDAEEKKDCMERPIHTITPHYQKMIEL